MKMRTKARAAFTVATVAAGLTACSQGGAGPGAGPGPGPGPGDKTITVQVLSGQDQLFTNWIAGFKKENPGVTVERTTVSQTAKTGSNIQVITSSNAPDVAAVPTNTNAYTELTQGKQLASVSDVWANQKLDARYGSTLSTTLKVRGTPYVVSVDSTIYNVVWYNEDLFKKAGITAPADHRIPSLNDLKGMVSKLKAVGAQGLSIGPGDNYQSSWMVDAFLPTSASAADLTSYLTAGQSKSSTLTAKFTDAPFVDSLKRIQDMGSAGVFQTGYLGQNVTQSEANFSQGKAGMVVDGSYSTPNFQSAKFQYDWMLLPPIDTSKKTQVSQYNGDAYAVPARAKNPTLGKKFLEYAMSEEGQAVLPGLSMLPAVNDLPQSKFSTLPKQVQELLADQKANGGQPGWTSVVPGALGQQLIDPLIQQMLNGSGTPDTIAQAVQTKFESTQKK